MIVTTILFKTWQPPTVPGRLVLQDDGVMFPSKPEKRMSDNFARDAQRKSFGDRAKARHAAKAAATAVKIKEFLIHNPGCTFLAIQQGIGMSESCIKAHIKAFNLAGNIEVGKRKLRFGIEKTVTWIGEA